MEVMIGNVGRQRQVRGGPETWTGVLTSWYERA